jgi:CBS domain-containing protein
MVFCSMLRYIVSRGGAGACFGRLVGHLLHAFDRRRGTFADSGTFALIGAAAGLGGMARMTISLVVILLEATGDIQYLVPLMLTVMLARWVGNCFNEGLYDIHIHLKKFAILEENDPDNGIVDVSVGDVMTPAPICFPPLISVYEVYDLLLRNRHHAFPVVGPARGGRGREEGGMEVLLGMVPRKVRASSADLLTWLSGVLTRLCCAAPTLCSVLYLRVLHFAYILCFNCTR